jgi:hypothetical protein
MMARRHYFGGHFDSDIYFDYLKPNSLISAYPITNFVYRNKITIHNKNNYTGEASGDLHGSNLMKALLRKIVLLTSGFG